MQIFKNIKKRFKKKIKIFLKTNNNVDDQYKR